MKVVVLRALLRVLVIKWKQVCMIASSKERRSDWGRLKEEGKLLEMMKLHIKVQFQFDQICVAFHNLRSHGFKPSMRSYNL